MDLSISEQLDRIEALQLELATQIKKLQDTQTQKEFYSVTELAKILGKAEFTVREWARNGRIHASRQRSGFGPNKSWRISHSELVRIQNEGLLPVNESAERND